ncbi:hypothetical protein MAM1_0362d10037 [Mucor ambiguus]|uniref:Uncharacterized protein n=1 Tax=Mucor ambiguus TaxID=91626 RepID=A0A0C9MI56_9FUNG|nr:hypothetical protein MAM1_0362d10037 [Mucor ambiguus]
MLQPDTTDLERAPVATNQITEAPSAIVETTQQLLDLTEPLNTGALSNLPKDHLRCKACNLPYVFNHYSISNRHWRGATCLGCNKLEDIESSCINSIGDEARHLNSYHLHPSTKIGLYHFPLSPSNYIKQTSKDGKEEYCHYATYEHTVEAYTRCIHCIEFVKRKRKTLVKATQKSLGRGVAGFDSLMEFMVNSNGTCALTGIKGSWSSFPGDPMYLLSLDHKVPLCTGGSSHIDNLQVTLQGFNNVKGDYTTEDFKIWFTAIKKMSKHELRS